MTQALSILSEETKVIVFRVFDEVGCNERAAIWGRVANLIEISPVLFLCSLFDKDMWYSAYLEVNRLDSENERSEPEASQMSDLNFGGLTLAKQTFIRLMIESHKIDKLISLPMRLPFSLLEHVMENSRIDLDKKQEILALISIVWGMPETFEKCDQKTCGTNPTYNAIAHTYKNVPTELLPSFREVSPQIDKEGEETKVKYHIIRPRFSEPAPSKMSNSPDADSFLEIHSHTVQPQPYAPIDEASIKPKRLEFASPHISSGSPGLYRR